MALSYPYIPLPTDTVERQISYNVMCEIFGNYNGKSIFEKYDEEYIVLYSDHFRSLYNINLKKRIREHKINQILK